MDRLVRDFIAVKSIEKQLGRKLTEEEINGTKPIKLTTQDGVGSLVFIEKIPFTFFYPEGSRR